jgi:hypothetical protein
MSDEPLKVIVDLITGRAETNRPRPHRVLLLLPQTWIVLVSAAVVILSEVDFSHLSDREILGGIMAFLAGLVLGLRF